MLIDLAEATCGKLCPPDFTIVAVPAYSSPRLFTRFHLRFSLVVLAFCLPTLSIFTVRLTATAQSAYKAPGTGTS